MAALTSKRTEITVTANATSGVMPKISANEKDAILYENSENDSSAAKRERVALVIRILYLSLYASMGCLQPFLPLYYHSLGHGGLIIGVLGAIRPLTTFLVSPLWGIASDKTSPHFILKITFLVSAIAQLFIPFRTDANFLLGLVLLNSIFFAPIKSLVDSSVMAHLASVSKKDTYGRFRLFGTLGFGLGTSMSGVLLSNSSDLSSSSPPQVSTTHQPDVSRFPYTKGIDKILDASISSKLSNTTLMSLLTSFKAIVMQFINQHLYGYRLAFVLFGFLCIPVFLCLQYLGNADKKSRKCAAKQSTVDTRQQEPQKSTTTSNTKHSSNTSTPPTSIKGGFYILIQNQDAVLFFFLIFVAGINGGCWENFAYVWMREMGGTTSQIGFGRLLASACGASIFWIAGPIIQFLGGATPILTATPILYGIRFCMLSYMTQPYHMYPAEIMRTVTFAIYWSAATTHAHQISPEGMNATMLMFLNAMYGGLGPSLGAIVFGKCQTMIGTAQSFICLATFDVCVSVLVGLFLYLKRGHHRTSRIDTETHNLSITNNSNSMTKKLQ